jgi:hypothetical protein
MHFWSSNCDPTAQFVHFKVSEATSITYSTQLEIANKHTPPESLYDLSAHCPHVFSTEHGFSNTGSETMPIVQITKFLAYIDLNAKISYTRVLPSVIFTITWLFIAIPSIKYFLKFCFIIIGWFIPKFIANENALVSSINSCC